MTIPAAAQSIQAGKNEPNMFCDGEALQPARHNTSNRHPRSARVTTGTAGLIHLYPWLSVACFCQDSICAASRRSGGEVMAECGASVVADLRNPRWPCR